METASLSEIKKELQTVAPQQLQDLCLRLAKYKKENKELLYYLLFEAINEQTFIQNVKTEIDEQFKQLNKNSFYLAKKTLRKALKTTDKYIKFSGSKETEIELLLHFCQTMKKSGIQMRSHRVVLNMYLRQKERIKKVHSSLHEDLQFDYEEAIEQL
jgi:hypothetical protein